MKYNDIDSESTRVTIDAIQNFEVLLQAREDMVKYKGNMFWRTLSGNEYLIRQVRAGIQKSLGIRNNENEVLYENFQSKKKELIDKISSLVDQQNKQARMCVAVRVNRVPFMVAQIARKLAEFPVLAKKTLIVGTNALYAYEATASVRFETSIVATRDVDVLWDSRKKISIIAEEPGGFMGLLKSVDKTFEVMRGSTFRAANKNGFMVDLIQPMKKNILITSAASLSEFSDDLVAVEIKGLEWLVSCPKFRAIVIDQKGYPAPMIVPDPRAFVMHKLWLSKQDEREPTKKKRDLEQSRAVFELVTDKLPFLDFGDLALQAMPFNLKQQVSIDFGFNF